MKKLSVPRVLKCLIWEHYIGKHFEGNCFCCDKIIDVFNYHAGHVEPSSKGGSMSLENLRPVCSSCNLSMSDKNMVDFINQYDMIGKKNFQSKFIQIGNIIYSVK